MTAGFALRGMQMGVLQEGLNNATVLLFAGAPWPIFQLASLLASRERERRPTLDRELLPSSVSKDMDAAHLDAFQSLGDVQAKQLEHTLWVAHTNSTTKSDWQHRLPRDP